MNDKREYASVSLEDQRKRIADEELKCPAQRGNTTTLAEGYCPSRFDGVMCWPESQGGVLQTQACPDYINGFRLKGLASKYCTVNGTWYTSPESGQAWTNYTSCMFPRESDTIQSTSIQSDHLHNLKIIYTVGYGISMIALFLAVFIMLFFRRLHCPRNIIHVNLFLSFMLRAAVCITKDQVFINGVAFASDVTYTDEGQLTMKGNNSHAACKILMSLFNYTIGVNYSWIFVEGLYLHVLVFVSVFSERGNVLWYILLGWGLPLLWIIPWAIIRIIYEDVLCWNTHPSSEYFLILQIPAYLLLVICFLFFINIVRVLFTKMKATNSTEAKKYRKLARSILVLIPLFGVHYIVFMALPDNIDGTTELVRLYFDTIITSSQGFLVAILFCFLNEEVQNEIKKKWCKGYREVFGSKKHSSRRSTIQTGITMGGMTETSPHFMSENLLSANQESVFSTQYPEQNIQENRPHTCKNNDTDDLLPK